MIARSGYSISRCPNLGSEGHMQLRSWVNVVEVVNVVKVGTVDNVEKTVKVENVEQVDRFDILGNVVACRGM